MGPLISTIDHLVVTAPSRALGVEYVSDRLGVKLVEGGVHPRMGTHNSLLRLNDHIYLEVIAIDPDSDPPTHPRWFELDQDANAAQPRLATWICRTSDIRQVVQQVPHDPGPITPMSRGSLEWLITIPQDGSLAMEGAAPSMIEWKDQHPVDSMPASGCELRSLELNHSAASLLRNWLQGIGFRGPLKINDGSGGTFGISAEIETPKGIVRL
ncbi:MAG: VOC family protein [Pirellulaceae bacterium]|nr:VOC family protein [Pirellulaceae bacterium]